MNNTVIITGASAGIGKALAYEFAKHNYDLLLVARSEDKLKKLCTELGESYGITARFLPLDLLADDAAEKLLGFVKDNNINASYLINNAGMGDAGLFEKSDIQKDDNIIRLNVLTLMRMNRLFIPYLRENGGGTIVNIASTLAFAPTAGEAVYAASKAFVLSFSQALYEETKKSNVSVLTICPGVTSTDFFKSAGFELGQFKAATPESFAAFAYRSIVKKKALSIHRISNKLTALFCRLATRKTVRKVFAAACKTE